MSNNISSVVRTRSESVLATNSVIRNTYILLSLSLLFSSFTAYLGYSMNLSGFGLGTLLIGTYGLMYLVNALSNSIWGIAAVFAFTGFMGLTLGPILNAYINGLSNGSEIVAGALGSTAAIFLALSGYAITTKKDFSYLAGFLFVVVCVTILASLASLFFHIPVLYLAVSCAFVLISSGYILFETSQIINGGQTNYILATISLYVSIYNLFVSLLQILTALSGRSRN
jgi:modulator of FtsH protease